MLSQPFCRDQGNIAARYVIARKKKNSTMPPGILFVMVGPTTLKLMNE